MIHRAGDCRSGIKVEAEIQGPNETTPDHAPGERDQAQWSLENNARSSRSMGLGVP